MTEKIKWYREVLELEPNSKIFFPLARLLAAENDYSGAIDTLEKGLARHEEYLEARLFLIELLHATGRKEQCDQQVERLAKMFSSYAGFWEAWAACLSAERKDEDMASILRFLAAQFISGPVSLHDVINRGVKSILNEKSAHLKDTVQHAHQGENVKNEKPESTLPNSDAKTEIAANSFFQPAQTAKDLGVEMEETTSENAIFQPYPEEKDSGVETIESLSDHNLISMKAESEGLEAEPPLEEQAEDNLPVFEEPSELTSPEPDIDASHEDISFTEVDNGEGLEESTNQVTESGKTGIKPSEYSENPVLSAENSIQNLEDNIQTSEIQATTVTPIEETIPNGNTGSEELLQAQPEGGESVIPEVDSTPCNKMADIDESGKDLHEAAQADIEIMDSSENASLPESGVEEIGTEIQPQEISQPEEKEFQEDEILNIKDEAPAFSNTGTATSISEDIPAKPAGIIVGPDNVPLMEDMALPEEEAPCAALPLVEQMAIPDDIEQEIRTENPQFNMVSLEESDGPESETLEYGNGEVENGEEAIVNPVSVRTRSMAEVLAEQGDIKGALEIYNELASAASDQAEAEDMRKRMETLKAKLASPPTPTKDAAEVSKEKLIDMLEALAHRVEERVKNPMEIY